MALYELAAIDGGDEALSELAEFRRLDDSHPQLFADVAIGRSDTLEVDYLSDEPGGHREPVDLTMPLRRWRACYTAALKIATLELAPASAEKKMSALMAWMQDEFCTSAPPSASPSDTWPQTARGSDSLKHYVVPTVAEPSRAYAMPRGTWRSYQSGGPGSGSSVTVRGSGYSRLSIADWMRLRGVSWFLPKLTKKSLGYYAPSSLGCGEQSGADAWTTPIASSSGAVIQVRPPFEP